MHGERLIEPMGIDQAELSRRSKSSPVKRTERRGLLRDVAVALGRIGREGAREALPGRSRVLGATPP